MKLTTLTPSQSQLLEAAACHPQHLLTNFPTNLKGGALIKVLTSLGNQGLIRPHSKAASGNTQFAITNEGLQAIGVQPPVAPKRAVSKQAILVEFMSRPEGATLPQMVQATGWQDHTVRGCLAGTLKKKLGLPIDCIKGAGGERVYRVAPITTVCASRIA